LQSKSHRMFQSRRRFAVLVCLLAGLFIVTPAIAQSADPQGPEPPATISRANGQVVIRAIHLSQPLTVDGKLDEAAYRDNLPIDGFIQTVPNNVKPVSEKPEAWVMFDDTYIYVSARLYESVPPNK